MTAAHRLAAARAAALAGALAAAGCAGPPWFMGQPLDGRPSITPGSARLTVPEWRGVAASERAAGFPVLEMEALLAIDDAARLTPEERARLAALLDRRAADFRGRGRAVAESRDLRRLERLSPARAAGLIGERADAERAAGDAWLAIGALREAEEAYRFAQSLGADGMQPRLLAAQGLPPPPEASLTELEAAIAALPLRGVPLLAESYITHGGTNRATLERSLAAAKQERAEGLAARVTDALSMTAPPPPSPSPSPPSASSPSSSPSPSPSPIPAPPNLDAWLLEGATVSGRLILLARSHPEILDGSARAKRWVDLMLEEDPTSTDVLEAAAVIFGRAFRFGGTERMLMELAYYTPDRAAGLARGAAVWDRLGRTREGCAQWIRAARWRDDPEDPTWRNAVTCARRDPGAGDWRAIRQYVLDRAPPGRRDAIAATLDAS